MKKLKEFWDSLDGYTIVRKRSVFLFMLNVLLLGMNLGMLISAALTPGEYETTDEDTEED